MDNFLSLFLHKSHVIKIKILQKRIIKSKYFYILYNYIICINIILLLGSRGVGSQEFLQGAGAREPVKNYKESSR